MSGNPAEHVVPVKTYGLVCALLLTLTYTTYRVALFDLGVFHPFGYVPSLRNVVIPMNVVAAIVIACTKASLVVLFFMHAAYSPRRTRMVILAGIFWMLLLLGLTLADYLTRTQPW